MQQSTKTDAMLKNIILDALGGMEIYMIKIFHCGDLHLDSPFAGCDLRQSEMNRKRLREVFSKMMRHVRENEYDLLLIAGDLYDCGFVTEETTELVTSELASLPCPVVISPGNHDPYTKSSLYACRKFSPNVKIFTEETLSQFDFDNLGVSVYGYAFCERSLRKNPLANARTASDGRINILCAHTEIGAPLSPYAPFSYADIDAAGFSYAALGHVHNAPEIHKGLRSTSAYCGFAEGRAFDETGFGGALSVSIFETGAEVTVSTERLIFASHRYEVASLDITGTSEDSEAREAISSFISSHKYGKETALRITLCGEVAIGYTPSISTLTLACGAPLALLELRDETLPVFDGSFLENDITLRGELYRILKEKMLSEGASQKDTSLAAAALRIGLAALEGRDLSPELAVLETASDDNGEED